MPGQTGVCVLVVEEKRELPRQYADQRWRLAGQHKGSGAIMVVDVPGQTRAAQRSSPPCPRPIGIGEGECTCAPAPAYRNADVHGVTVRFGLPVLQSEPESVRFLGT